jgi:uncharacterized lipoprotein YajG
MVNISTKIMNFMDKWIMNQHRTKGLFNMMAAVLLFTACTPTVQVAVPNEPITINLNVRIEHEIRVQVEEELDNIFSENSGLF